MAGLKRHPYLLGLMAFSMDDSVTEEVVRWLWVKHVTALAVQRKWKVAVGKQELRKLTALAILELRHPRKYNTVDKRAEFMGCKRRWWYVKYAERYAAIDAVVGNHLGEALSHVWRKQRQS